MLTLYPAIKPYTDYVLQVDNTHSIYVEECGEPDGIPVLFLHGGPGGGCSVEHRRFFDPKRYRIILFDQRGSGRSKPHASLVNNTTQDLIADIEQIRKHCQVEQWMLFGGSWGATLALLYAQAYPNLVTSMVLRGIFLGRSTDLQWFYQQGAAKVFPDHWKNFIRPIARNKRDNLIDAYYELLIGSDEIVSMAAAKAWARWEAVCSTLHPNPQLERQFTQPRFVVSMAKIAAHYFTNKLFIEENTIIKHMASIAHIPSIIVHGRYDMICPLDNAYELHNAWPESQLQIIRDAGHSAMEPGTTNALIHATKQMAC